jgi:hypothetical protein
MKTRPTTDNGNDLRIIRHSGCEINHRDEYQDGKESHNQIDDPEGIKMDQEIGYI